jgi:hypothetical protein
MYKNLMKVKTIKEKINEESEMIENYESEIEEIKEVIRNYENDYDYKSDPSGNDYDLRYISEKNHEIEILENLITRCELEISDYETEIEDTLKSSIQQSKIRLESVDDIRKHFGHISSSNLLKIWIKSFGINELANDLKWIYRDEMNQVNQLIKILKK